MTVISDWWNEEIEFSDDANETTIVPWETSEFTLIGCQPQTVRWDTIPLIVLYRGSSSILVSGKSVLLSLFPAAASASLILLSISTGMLATYLKLCKKIQILKVFSKLLVIMLLWACWLCICGTVLQVHPKWRSSIRQDLREIFPGTKVWEGPLLLAGAGGASVTGWPRWSMSIILYHISCSWPGVSQHRHQHITSC